jgi:DNA repair protein RecO
MRQIVTQGIVLARTDYGEADRILTILTSSEGKIRVIAKGVRKVKSKLAGGIELFSISDITFIAGKRDIGTLVSTRLQQHFGTIVQDLDRTMLAYSLLKRTNKVTEDEPGDEYFTLLSRALIALNGTLPLNLLEAWFDAQLLELSGHQPNLRTDAQQRALEQGPKYTFGIDTMCFAPQERGQFTADHIKLLRIIFSSKDPSRLQQIEAIESLVPAVHQLITTMRNQHITQR